MGREVELAKKNCQKTWEILKLMTDIQHAQELEVRLGHIAGQESLSSSGYAIHSTVTRSCSKVQS
jgi:PleD family two-component response regulator